MKPKRKIKIEWSPEFAYAIGLLTTDGNLSSDRRYFDFTSNDEEQMENFIECLGIKNKIGKKRSGCNGRVFSRVQFGDVEFYKFLLSIGLMPCKSKILGEIKIPKKYFFDFLRGHFDGDGTFFSYWDSRWRSSFMFYTEFVSASRKHIFWLRDILRQKINIKGHLTKSRNSSVYQLKYAKNESLKLLPKLYYNSDVICLTRKRNKIVKVLRLVGSHL